MITVHARRHSWESVRTGGHATGAAGREAPALVFSEILMGWIGTGMSHDNGARPPALVGVGYGPAGMPPEPQAERRPRSYSARY